MSEVIISGGGPTGMMLAAELRLHGVDVLVLEREAEPSQVVRSLGLHPRTIEILDQRGILDRFLAEGTRYPGAARFAGIDGPRVDLNITHGYLLGIPQPISDRILSERAAELGAHVRRAAEIVHFEQDDEGVTVELAGGEKLRAAWLVGADGGRSLVRKRLGVGFPGEAARTEWLLAEVQVTAPPEDVAAVSERVRATQKGFGIGPVGIGWYRAVVPAAGVSEDRGTAPAFEEFRARLRAVAGTDLGAHSPRWLSRFTDATRLAERYRVGRVLLAGDAAHVHPPLGGQGLNLGIQDAFNLGFKLAAELAGWAPDGLLDSYETERRPVADEVLNLTRAQSELLVDEPGPRALRRLLGELLRFENVSLHLAEKVAGLDIRYDVDGGTEPLGRRMPDVTLGSGTLYSRLHSGRGLLLDRTGTLTLAGWEDRVDLAMEPDAAFDHPAALVRPDGYIAWVGSTQAELDAAAHRWFGARSPDSAAARRLEVSARNERAS